MTEAAHQMTSNPLPKHGPHKAGTVGRAQGSVKVPPLFALVFRLSFWNPGLACLAVVSAEAVMLGLDACLLACQSWLVGACLQVLPELLAALVKMLLQAVIVLKLCSNVHDCGFCGSSFFGPAWQVHLVGPSPPLHTPLFPLPSQQCPLLTPQCQHFAPLHCLARPPPPSPKSVTESPAW